MKLDPGIKRVLNLIFGLIFIVIGILNFIKVHAVPGVFYLLLSLVYLLPAGKIVKHRFRFSIPFRVKVILFIIVMWATLAVGDLAEMYGL